MAFDRIDGRSAAATDSVSAALIKIGRMCPSFYIQQTKLENLA